MKKLALSFALLVLVGLAVAFFDHAGQLALVRIFASGFIAVWVLSIYRVIEYNRKN